MRLGPALRIARAELRGGREALPVFILCLALGVASVAGVSSTLTAISQGLSLSARDLLGGDIEVRFVHRFADEQEADFLEGLGLVSQAVSFRGMLSPAGADGGNRTLVQVKGVDGQYPLYGALELDPPLDRHAAFDPGADGVPGIATAPELAARFGLEPGDRVRLGSGEFEYRASIVSEPDRSTSRMQFGPRLLADLEAIRSAGLLERGSLFYPRYRLQIEDQADLQAIRADAAKRFPDSGWRWRDRSAGVPGVERFVQRLGSFLSLVALAALALGGIGAGSAIRAFLQRKTTSIATLRAVGAGRGTIAAAYIAQTLAIATVGVVAGLAIGAGVPALLGPTLSDLLPVPAVFGVYGAPLILSAAAGYLTALLFSLAPLASACETSAASVFRAASAPMRTRVTLPWAAGIAASATGLFGVALLLSRDLFLAGWFAGGFAVAIVLLFLIGQGIARLCKLLAPRLRRAPPALRRAVAQIAGAGGDAGGISVSLGTAISILGAVALISHSLRAEIGELAGDEVPAFFVLDLPREQISEMEAAAVRAGASRVQTAPMLRGFVTRLNGVPTAEAQIQQNASWVLRGDRGLTYSEEAPEDARILEGDWWPADYDGPPLVSFAAEEARELGLGVGSTVTVNVLGRPLTATIANLRELTWQGLGINFLMIFDPKSLSVAPHQNIATVYMPEEGGEAFLADLGECCPAATAVSVQDGINAFRGTLEKIAAAALWGSAVTVLTGLAVLAGVAAAGQRRQIYESAIWKALGATRREILSALALKWSLLGAASALAALFLGAVGAWATLRFVMDLGFAFSVPIALLTTAAGAIASLAAGLGFARAAVGASPATLLRGRD